MRQNITSFNFTTYLKKEEKRKFSQVTEPVLNWVFQEVRKLYKGMYYIQEWTEETKRFLRKKEVKTFYVIYVCKNNTSEVQCLSFYHNNVYYNTRVPGSLVALFFLGLVDGYNAGRENKLKVIKEAYELGRAHEKNNVDLDSNVLSEAWIKAERLYENLYERNLEEVK